MLSNATELSNNELSSSVVDDAPLQNLQSKSTHSSANAQKAELWNQSGVKKYNDGLLLFVVSSIW